MLPLQRAACLLAAIAVALSGCWRSTPPVERPRVPKQPAVQVDLASLPLKYKDHNLVFVSFDALQAAHVGALGYERDTTPALDAFAADSFLFARAHSVSSWTVPSSMTWFTGVYPSEHRMVNKFAVYNHLEQTPARLQDLAPELVTLAELLKQHGYATGGFTGNAGVSGGFGYEAGFDTYYDERGKFGSFDQSIPEALAWLREHRDEKFFLFLHGYDAHGQSTPEEGFDYRFVDKSYDGRYLGSEQEQETLREEGLEKGAISLREEDVHFWRAIYDEKIQRADKKFRHFLAEFDSLGLTGKTLFVLTSDHGTEFYEHRRFDHGFTLYQEQIHVPLVIRLPGQQGGRVVDDRVSSVDLMPTIVDLLDLQLPEEQLNQLRGESLTAAMLGRAPPRDVISETDYREFTFKRSIVSPDGWKLIVTLESSERELYQLDDDPEERTNLASERPEIVDRLQVRLFAHFAMLGHDLSASDWQRGFNPVYPSQEKK
jgi:choline-sulfatase